MMKGVEKRGYLSIKEDFHELNLEGSSNVSKAPRLTGPTKEGNLTGSGIRKEPKAYLSGGQ